MGRLHRGILSVSLLLSFSLLHAEPGPPIVLAVVPDHADGLYAQSEQVTWTVDVKSGDRALLKTVPYVVKKDAADPVAQGTIDLSAGPATVTASRPEPGALFAVFSSPDPAVKKPLALGGALVAADKVGPALPEPADFDAFWQGKLKDLAAVPPNPVVEKGTVDGVKGIEPKSVDYYKVTLDNVGGTHVRGQLARPATGEKFPAILVLQWAGVYGLDKSWVANLARQGFLVLDVEAHDIPIDEAPAFYENLKDTTLKDYVHLGDESRETSYFLRMFLGDVQAANYLASRPDWDGRTFVVAGTSQGGLQSFATAALFPKATQMMVLVPAGCDVEAPFAVPPRAVSWPDWMNDRTAQGKDMAKVKEAAAYFDPIYFASRIACPALVGVGLLDETARPAGIAAAFNALKNPAKELLPMPFASHSEAGGVQAAYYTRAEVWRAAIKAGEPLPPPAVH